MRPRASCAALLLGWIPIATLAFADIYTWVDKEGAVHFQEAPPDSGGARMVRTAVDEPPAPRNPPSAEEGGAPSPAPRGAAPAEVATRSRLAPRVELFSTSWCPYCKKARKYFSERGIAFVEHDIEKDPGALKRKMALDGDKRVPTAIIGGRVVRGYLPSAYQSALGET
ncbi:MAG TPA: glutaredoxin family protein [Anaeromyxobacteraceae bacterium]|nr:glutaredoxin family protein [Anaeromyxobacteraceae bacterium]